MSVSGTWLQESHDGRVLFQSIKGALSFLLVVRSWWPSLLNDDVNSSPAVLAGSTASVPTEPW